MGDSLPFGASVRCARQLGITTTTAPAVLLVLLIWSVGSAVTQETIAIQRSAPVAADLVTRFESSVEWRERFALHGRTATKNIGFNDAGRWKHDLTYYRSGALREWQLSGSAWGDTATLSPLKNINERSIRGEDFYAETRQEDLSRPPAGTIYDHEAIESSHVKKRMKGREAGLETGGFIVGSFQGMLGKDVMDLLNEASEVESVEGDHWIDDKACHLLRFETKFGTVEVWIAPDYGFSAMKYRISRGEQDYYNDRTLTEIGVVAWSAEIHLSEFQLVEGQYIPLNGDYRQTVRRVNGDETGVESHVEIDSIDLDPPFDELHAFSLTFPEGTLLNYALFPALSYEFKNGRISPIVEDKVVDAINLSVDDLNFPDGTEIAALRGPRREENKSNGGTPPPAGAAPRHSGWRVGAALASVVIGAVCVAVRILRKSKR